MVEHNVAMSIGVVYAAFITKQRRKAVAHVEDVVRFFGPPPVVFDIAAHVVVADDSGIHLGSVDHIAIIVFD